MEVVRVAGHTAPAAIAPAEGGAARLGGARSPMHRETPRTQSNPYALGHLLRELPMREDINGHRRGVPAIRMPGSNPTQRLWRILTSSGGGSQGAQ
jgi:hypothetical protein